MCHFFKRNLYVFPIPSPYLSLRESNIYSSSSSYIAIPASLSFASCAVFCLGLNSGAPASSLASLLSFLASRSNYSGYKCLIGRSKCDFPALNFTTLTIPSRPLIISSTIPMFHLPQFLYSPLIRTTSPAFDLTSLL